MIIEQKNMEDNVRNNKGELNENDKLIIKDKLHKKFYWNKERKLIKTFKYINY